MANLTISDLHAEQLEFQELQELDYTELKAVVGGVDIILIQININL